MTLQQLIYIINIAQTGSLSKTAEHLYITPPSLSKSLREQKITSSTIRLSIGTEHIEDIISDLSNALKTI